MSNPQFTINTDDINVTTLVQQIRDTVAEKQKAGAYADAQVATAERSNLTNLKDDAAFIDHYLQCMNRSSIVDIREFPIPDSKGGLIGKSMQKFKKTLWSSLKFYTYRMWTQQNQINSLITNGIQVIQNQQVKRSQDLQTRIDRLEAALLKAGIQLPPDNDNT